MGSEISSLVIHKMAQLLEFQQSINMDSQDYCESFVTRRYINLEL